ncbi:MAG: protoporphyrinogen oxidase [Acidobacteria bacterium]|nr:protoporphyrinogen oxidase [Acidobacteriota bacterium]
MQSPAQTVVIGGGISGLACAFRLCQLGIPVLLLEQSQRVGGVIDSVQQDGFLFERGPQSFLSTDLLLELIDALGLGPELLRADPRAPRYILTGGRLEPVPMAPPALLTTPLLGISSKWKLLSEPFRRSQPPANDESVADFVRRKFGSELLELLVGPFVSGVYAGDPEKLSLRSAFPSAYQWEKDYGSVLRGAIKSRPPKEKPRATLCTFRDGVVTLVRTLGEKLGDAVHRGASVISVRRGKTNCKSQFELQVTSHGRTELLRASAVVVATATEPAGRLLAGISEQFPMHFAKIEYAPVAVVASGYRREQMQHPAEGFGFLVPQRERLRVLGTVWNSSLFAGRAPAGMVNLTSFAGGATDPDLLHWSDAEVADTVAQEVARVLKITGPPVTSHVQRYACALPQYNLGHNVTIEALRELCAASPVLFLTGNYLEGPSIGVCVEQAFRTARGVQQYLALTGELAHDLEGKP